MDSPPLWGGPNTPILEYYDSENSTDNTDLLSIKIEYWGCCKTFLKNHFDNTRSAINPIICAVSKGKSIDIFDQFSSGVKIFTLSMVDYGKHLDILSHSLPPQTTCANGNLVPKLNCSRKFDKNNNSRWDARERIVCLKSTSQIESQFSRIGKIICLPVNDYSIKKRMIKIHVNLSSQLK